MKLWILRPITMWKPWYDTSGGHVVRAKDENAARAIAESHAGDEGAAAWSDPSKTTCKELKQTGKAEHIIVDFHAA